jgi:hypothetical protein
MTAKQMVEYAAYTTFLLLIAAEDAIAKSLPAFFRYSQTLKGWMGEVDGHKAAAQQSTTGITEDKNKVKALLLEQMSLLTSLVIPFADDTNNTILLNRIKAFPTAFARTRQHEIATLCQDVIDKITPYLADLADYGVTEDQIPEIQDLINDFDGKVPTTRSLIKESTVNTGNRDELFDKMSDLVLNKILFSAKGFNRNKNGVFYKKVVAALTVDTTQAATTTLRIKFKYTTGKHASMRLAARVAGSDVHHTANEKNIITMKFDKGGLYDIEIPVEGGEPIKRTGILLVKGRSKTITIEL